MSVRTVILFACSAIALSSAPGGAQSLRNLASPAEFPPATYTSAQYVDSKDCVFIRAGVGANTTWVPRMSRSREQLCGFSPSLAAATPEVQTEAAPQTRAAVVPAPQAAQPQTRPVAPVSPQPRVRTVTPAPQAAQPVRTTVPAAVAATRPEPQPVSAAPRAQPGKTARVIAAPDLSRTACAGMTGVSAAYMVQHNGSPVRCGPQAAPYVTYARTDTIRRPSAPVPGTLATPSTVPPRTLVAPARVYASQKTSLAGVTVPEGMKPVWEDDRLNPRRAHQTFEGKQQMEVMWTNTVPRRLINRHTGASAIHNPGLQPPFTSFEAQRAAGVTVSTRGVYVPDTVASKRAARGSSAQPQTSLLSGSTGQTATVSTRSPDSVPEPTRPIYAQAGLFADAAQGRAAATRIAGTGLPARQGTLSRGGRELTLVLAGPFTTKAEAERGAARLRGMGFSNVRLR